MPDNDLAAAVERLRLYFDDDHYREESEVYDAAWHARYGNDLAQLKDLHGGSAPVVVDWRTVADAYLARESELAAWTDPTPLTLDVLRRELGEPDWNGALGGSAWNAAAGPVVQLFTSGRCKVDGRLVYTLGQLRRMLSVIEETNGGE